MKLKEGFITHTTGGEHVMVAAGKAADVFHGVVMSNETAAFIIEQLKKETSRDAIIDAMLAEYEADRETIAAGVDNILNQLREIEAIEE